MSLEQHLQVFDLHDVSLTKSLSKKEVANVLRTCGRLATPKEMEALLKPLPEVVSRTEFAELVNSLKAGPRDSDLLTALQAFDHKELGTLSRVDVTTIFTQMNEKVTHQELEGILKSLPFGADDRVGIDVLVKKLLTPFKSINVPPNEVHMRMMQ